MTDRGKAIPGFVLSLLSCTALLWAREAPADPGGQWNEPAALVVGAAGLPEFEGADALRLAPLVVSRFSLGATPVQITGTQVRVGVAKRTRWWAGPLLAFVPPRDDSVSDARIARFEAVDLSFEAGGFIGYRRPVGNLDEGLLEASLSLRGPVSGDWEGRSAALELEYSWAASFMWRLAVGGAVRLIDDDYAKSRFGVSAADAERSGLNVFDARGGLHDVGVSIRSIVSFNPAWGVFTRVGYTRLLADAADSPVVTEAGSADQWFVGIGVFRNLLQ